MGIEVPKNLLADIGVLGIPQERLKLKAVQRVLTDVRGIERVERLRVDLSLVLVPFAQELMHPHEAAHLVVGRHVEKELRGLGEDRERGDKQAERDINLFPHGIRPLGGERDRKNRPSR